MTGAAPHRPGPTRRACAAGLAAIGVAGRSQAATGPGLPIFVYHRFDPATAGPTTVTLGAFEAQLAWLAAHGWRIAPLAAVLAQLRSPPPAGLERLFAITVDDGHASVRAALFPLLLRRRLPATLFVYPSAISNAAYALTWAQLREMQASGLVDVQSHTYWHPNFRTEKKRLDPAAYRVFVDGQLRRSRAVLEQRLEKPVDVLAWPFGIVDAELETAALAAGYRAGFAYEGGAARPGGDMLALARIPVTDAVRGFGGLLDAGSRP